MIGDPIPDPRHEALAKLNASIDEFFAKGGKSTEAASFERKPLPERSPKVDPQTVLTRRRRRPSPIERATLRKLAEDL